MTALAATIIPGTATNPPAVRLDVTAAPNPPATAYTSNFAAGLDSWSAQAGTPTVSNDTSVSPAALYVRRPYPTAVANTVYDARRTVTGLTIGTTYRFKAAVRRVDAGQVRLSVVGSTTGTWVTGGPVRTFVEISFTATATSHVIVVGVLWPGNPLGGSPGYNIDTVTVVPTSTWPGTRIYRTDVNGYGEVRKPDAGLDVVGGSMTLYDLEAALYGKVTYNVVDGAGATTVVSVGNGEGLRNEFPNPATNDGTTSPFISGNVNVALTLSAGVPNPAVVPNTAWRFELSAALANANLIAYTSAGLIPAQAGDYWSARVSVRRLVGAAAISATVQLIAADAGGATLAVVDADTGAAPEGKWGTFDVVATTPMPAGTVSVRVYIRNSGAWVSGAVLFVSAVQLSKVTGPGAPVTEYIDGDLIDPNGRYTYRWINGNTTSKRVASVKLDPSLAGLPWLSNPGWDTNPVTGYATGAPVPSVLNYDESEERTGELRQVIARRDPVGNPGVMTLRRGALSLWFNDYADARAARSVLDRSQTVLLRQPDFPGMDLYFNPSRVKLEPASLETQVIRWQVTVDYDEVLAP